MVRIRFPPAASLRTTGSAVGQSSSKCRRTVPAVTSGSSCSVDGSMDGSGVAISSLARAILALQVALASNP